MKYLQFTLKAANPPKNYWAPNKKTNGYKLAKKKPKKRA